MDHVPHSAFDKRCSAMIFFGHRNVFPRHISMQHAPQTGKKTIAVFLPFWGALHLNTIRLYPLRLSWMGLQGKPFFGHRNVFPRHVSMQHAPQTGKKTIAVFLPFWGALHLNTIRLYPLRLSWMDLQGGIIFGHKNGFSLHVSMQHAPQTGEKTIAVFLPLLGRIAFEHDSALSLTAFLDGVAGETVLWLQRMVSPALVQ